MVFYRSLSDGKSPQVSRTPFSILVGLNNAVVWTVSTRPVIFKSSSLCTNPLLTIPSAPIIIGIIITFMFYSFFNSLARSMYLSLFLNYFNYSVVHRDCKVHNPASSLFFVDYYKVWSSGWDKVIRLYLKILKEFVCHSPWEILGCL